MNHKKKLCENKDFCNVITPSEDTKVILKNRPQQKWVNIFHQVFQCLQYHHLKAQKISMMYTDLKIEWKSVVNL